MKTKWILAMGILGLIGTAHAAPQQNAGQEGLALGMACVHLNTKGVPTDKMALQIFNEPGSSDAIAIVSSPSGQAYAAYTGKLDFTRNAAVMTTFASRAGDLKVSVTSQRVAALTFKGEMNEMASDGKTLLQTAIACVPNIGK